MRRRSPERGAAALEFALVAPLLVLLVLGVTDVARLASSYQAASVCVRAGAREASLIDSTIASVQAATNTCLTSAKFSTVTPTISPSDPATIVSGAKVTVSFTLVYSSWFGLLFANKTMHFSCSMMKQH